MSLILVVHPDGKASETLTSILEKSGHRTVSAPDGPRALAAFARHKPDIVIVNHVLPSMASFQLFAEIRRIAPQAKVLLFELLGAAGQDPARAPLGVRGLRPSEVLQVVEEIQNGEGERRSGPDATAPRVLIVDDDAAVRETVRRLLTEKGHEVFEASSGAGAISAVKRIRPHLVLLDIDMPGMSGVETLRRIRESDGTAGVMMITGNDELETMALCRDYGAYDYLVKPFDLQYLEFSVYSKILLMTV